MQANGSAGGELHLDGLVLQNTGSALQVCGSATARAATCFFRNCSASAIRVTERARLDFIRCNFRANTLVVPIQHPGSSRPEIKVNINMYIYVKTRVCINTLEICMCHFRKQRYISIGNKGIYQYIHIYICILTHTNRHELCVSLSHTNVHTHIHTHTQIHTDIQTHIHMHMHTHADTHTYIHTYTHANLHQNEGVREDGRTVGAWAGSLIFDRHIHIQTYTYIYIYTCVYIYVHIYTYI